MNKKSKILTAVGSALLMAGVGVASGEAFAATTVTSPVSVYTPITPTRIVDTRDGSPVPANGSLSFGVTTPGGATGVVLNVTVVSAAKNGDIVVDPAGLAGPTSTSNNNFQAGINTANEVGVQLGGTPSAPAVTIYNQSAGTIQLVVDEEGYYTPAANVVGVQGPQGPIGLTGPTGATGASGITFYTVKSPLYNQSDNMVVSCTSGDQVTGGGYQQLGGIAGVDPIQYSMPTTVNTSNDSWEIYSTNPGAGQYVVWAICEHSTASQ